MKAISPENFIFKDLVTLLPFVLSILLACMSICHMDAGNKTVALCKKQMLLTT